MVSSHAIKLRLLRHHDETKKRAHDSQIVRPERLASFVGHFCFLWLVFLMLLRLFIAVLWSPAGKELTSRLLLVMFIVFLLLSHVVSLDGVLDCIIS